MALRSVLAYCSEIVLFNQAKPFSDCPPHVGKHTSFAIFCRVFIESVQNIRDAAIKVGKAFLNQIIRGPLQNSATNPVRTLCISEWINQIEVGVGWKSLKFAFNAVCYYALLARVLRVWNLPEINVEFTIMLHFPSQESRI